MRVYLQALLTALLLGVVAGRAEIVFEDGFEAEILHPRWIKNREDTTLANFETRKEHVHSGRKSFHITLLYEYVHIRPRSLRPE